MWPVGSFSISQYKGLYEMFEKANSGSILPSEILSALNQLTKEQRKQIVDHKINGSSVFFHACIKGCVSIVDYFIAKCNADLNQPGIGSQEVDGILEDMEAPPLWFAAADADFRIMKRLIKNGADINCANEMGITALIWVCHTKRTKVIKYLVDQKADVNKKSGDLDTCLMTTKNSKVCKLLLDNGARIDAGNYMDETALIKAVQYDHWKKAKFLSKIADLTLRNRQGDDALTVACLRGNERLFSVLRKRKIYSNFEMARAHELLGGAIVDNFGSGSAAVQHWRTALELRGNLQKEILPPHSAYGYVTEFQTAKELAERTTDAKSLGRQSLLIKERILGSTHPYTVDLITSHCAAYLNNPPFNQPIDLWTYATELCIQSDGMLGLKTLILLQDFGRKVILCLENGNSIKTELKSLIFNVVEIVTKELPKTVKLLKLQPMFEEQKIDFQDMMQVIFSFIYILDCLVETDYLRVTSLVRDIVKCNPRTIAGDSLLHMAVFKDRPYLNGPIPITLPKLRLTSLLYECGAKVNDMNSSYNTPLHVASSAHPFDPEVMELLLSLGAHVDFKNSENRTPLDLLRLHTDYSLCKGHYLKLECLAAIKIREHLDTHQYTIPQIFREFVLLH